MGQQRAHRAAIFAALGEPARLGIVDRLVPGDASPGELAAELGLGTNLLAHHLRVLEEAGVVRRVRSEGDRRRTYVQLRLDDATVWAAALTGRLGGLADAGGPRDRGSGGLADADGPRDRGPGELAAAAGAAPLLGARLVFVCTANSARSQLAAAVWSRLGAVPATSAGTRPGPRIHPRTVSLARRHGLRLVADRPVALADRLRERDFVVAVCDSAHEELRATIPRLHWSVPDPVRTDTDAAFEAAYADIARRVQHLAVAYGVVGEGA